MVCEGDQERSASGNTRLHTRRSSSLCGTAMTCVSKVCSFARLFYAGKSGDWGKLLGSILVT